MRQGCILSSQLFNIYDEYTIRETLEYWTGGIFIGGRRISNLRYADDTTLIASDEEEMAELVNLVKIASEKLGLGINASKTKIMVVDQAKCLSASTALSEYDKINAFVYLGSIIETDGSLSAEIRRRIVLCKSAMTSLGNVRCKDKISKKTRKRLLYSRLFSLFSYIARKRGP